jgi:hypothetical protein
MGTNFRNLFRPSARHTRGVALIIVLAAMVLLAILVLAFLTGIGTELQSSKMYANGSSVKLLAQSAVALVTGEIQAATADPTLCWASQPGMIRTYKNDGTANGYFKLYSDSGMYGTGAFDHTQAANLVPNHLYGGGTDWYNQKGVYVDLNQPIYLNGNNYYPILDGNSADYSSTQYTTTLSPLTRPAPSSSAVKTLIPVPATGPVPAVTGFWLDGNTPIDSTSPNVAPMPVKWLYVLKNGEVIVPDSNPVSGTVTFNHDNPSQPQPSSNDPIVGRMAFWTDDETCKVNINTASDGFNSNTSGTGGYGYKTPTVTTGTVVAGTKSTFWDTPRTDTPQDYGFAYSQPVQNEFQRYPGHPATVALSAVFNSLTSDANFPENVYSTTSASSLAPRISGGGSKEGTQSTVNATPIGANTLNQLGYRLYTTPDEFLFRPKLASGSPGTGLRDLNTAPVPEINAALVQQAKFFITANSESPDVNVFNLPRISMWPITLNKSTGAQMLTPYDQLLSFCSTTGQTPNPTGIYYFQRQDPNSPMTDLPATSATTGVGRNRQLIEYLRTLTSQPLPGFGGIFASKYPNGDRDQILTEMFDYIRSTNLQDTSLDTFSNPDPTTGVITTTYSWPGKFAPPLDTGTLITDPYTGGGVGQVVPIVDTNISATDSITGKTTNPRGFGRFPTVQQAALIFIGAGDNSTDQSPDQAAKPGPPAVAAVNNPNPPYSYSPQVKPGYERVQAGFFLQMFDPSQGVAVTRPWYTIKVSGLDGLQWGNGNSIFPLAASFPYSGDTTGVSLQPTAAGINYNVLYGLASGRGDPGFTYGGVIDFRQQNLLRGSITGGSWTATGHFGLPIYPYISPPTGQPGSGPDLPAGGTFSFTQTGDVVVQIFSLSSSGVASTTPIQTINLKFPSASFPVPYSIDNNQINAAPYNVPPFTTPTYYTFNGTATVVGVPPSLAVASPSASSYLAPVATAHPGPPVMPTTYAPASAANVDFLSFLDSYGSAHTLGSAIARLDFGSMQPLVTSCDVIRAIVATPGDMRLLAARQNVPDSMYQPITGSNIPTTADYNNGFAAPFSHMLRMVFGAPVFAGIGGRLISLGLASTGPADYQLQYLTRGGVNFYDSTCSNPAIQPADADVPNQKSSVVMGSGTGTVPGDWDTGFANARDGAYINKADEGDTGSPTVALKNSSDQNTSPYYEVSLGGIASVGATFFSPNRMIPSPGMFGSLPTGVWANQPWQTLLFRPGPAGHKGLGVSASGSGDSGAPYTTPPDHLFLDLFNMPVVEPYAISTPLATAGRINMNYLIVPFTYINRDTGLRAVMKNQMMTALPTSIQATYKSSGNVSGGAPTNTITTRYSINLDSTLSQFLARFYNTGGTQGATGTPDIFHSASEICDIDLVPKDSSPATLVSASNLNMPITRGSMDTFWNANALTGDNIRERPYANIYPLLTTKSNSFTVHYRVQTLKQVPNAGADPTKWREGNDVVLAEYRGSQTIERYVDPNAAIPDYAALVSSSNALPTSDKALSQYYKFRIVSTKQFPP